MAASDYGYYRSDGIQNSGTALRQNGNAYIYNSAGQIYPRQITETDVSIIDIADNVSYQCMTLRSGYNSNVEKGSWRTDVAYQGFYWGSDGQSQQSCGHFFSSAGKPSVGGSNVIDFRVKYVRIEMNRRNGAGYYNNDAVGHLRMSNLINCYAGGNTSNPFRSGRWSELDQSLLNAYDYTFNWLPSGNITVLESGDPNSALCQFIKSFLSDGRAKTLCVYNGEMNVRPFSRNYAACDNDKFRISIKVDRTVQL